MHFSLLPAKITILAALSLAPASAQLSSTQKEDIGLTELQALLGASMPTGEGISLSQVEAPDTDGNYRPNPAVFTDKTFSYPSGGATGNTGHATTVGKYFYGVDSVAPNAGTTASSSSIKSYETNDWLGSFLNTSGALPSVETSAVQNHSWVGSTGSTSTDTEILRRADFAITRDNHLQVSALNNGTGSLPNLLSQSYNGIVVGLSSANHSSGLTTIDGSNRSKPDIVAPTSATSYAAPTVAGAGAMLLSAAEADTSLANATRHEVTKALILNGATKDESEFSGSWSHTQTSPLDSEYGVGELNIYRSYQNMFPGEFDASDFTFAGKIGWDLGTASETASQLYHFQIPEGYEADLTATLAWDRIVTPESAPGPPGHYTFSSYLANLDLQLFSSDGFVLGPLLDQSISSVDNVEHLYTLALQAGEYALAVNSDTLGNGQEYGLAWITDLHLVPEPSHTVLIVLGVLSLLRRRR